MNRTSLNLAGLIILAGLSFSFPILAEPTPPTPNQTDSLPVVRFTQQKYDQIKDGMTYGQVSKILGDPGQKIAGFIARWVVKDGSIATILFEEDKAIELEGTGVG